MSPASTVTDAILTKIVAFLAPLFLDTCCGDIEIARATAATVLASYNARTDHELRLAALILAFSLGALDALARAVNPELTENQVLRLRGNANALNRAALQNQKALDDLQSDRVTVPDEPMADLPASSATSDLVSFARTAPAPLSRQQRRAAERQAEKARKRQEAAARLVQRVKDRQHAA